MSFANSIVSLSMKADASLGFVRRSILGEKPGMISILFHNIFQDQNALSSRLAYPQEGVTQIQFRTFLDCWLKAGYRFVSTRNILAGLDVAGKYVLLTFDDGYRSILDILPILEEFQAPVILFVTSNSIETGQAYWPDIVYREEIVGGKSTEEASNLVESLKEKHSSVIQQFMLDRYGAEALFAMHDIARPLTANELTKLANHPLIEIGNHTKNHDDLTLCNIEEIRREIYECQRSVERMTGRTSIAISYPFGRFNDDVITAVQKERLHLGFTCEEGKNRLPLNSNALKIRRYDFLGDSSPTTQCDRFRSDIYFFWPIVKTMFSIAITLRRKLKNSLN
ncbi:MAG TPA: polysaccharide deacetylase family protein [Hanamia sp.]